MYMLFFRSILFLIYQEIAAPPKSVGHSDVLASTATTGYTPWTENYGETPFPLREASPLRCRVTLYLAAPGQGTVHLQTL